MNAAVSPTLVDTGRQDSVQVANALTVDVEEYFQVAAFERTIPREGWATADSRVELSTGRVLDLFASSGVKATFFTLGWIAEKHPALVRRIVADGHELASHGYDHTRLHHFTTEQFRADVLRTKAILEDIAGVEIRGYRAPSYSIGFEEPLDARRAAGNGNVYSSSIYPIRHDLYGMPEAPRFPFRFMPDGILEIPVTTVRSRIAIFLAEAEAIFGCCRIRCSAGPCTCQRIGRPVRTVLFPSLGSRPGPAPRPGCVASSPASVIT